MKNGPLTPTELAKAGKLLRAASGVFANHGCNDMPIRDTPENRAFARDVLAARGPGEDAEPKVGADGLIYLLDWEVMDYLADRISRPKVVPMVPPPDKPSQTPRRRTS